MGWLRFPPYKEAVWLNVAVLSFEEGGKHLQLHDIQSDLTPIPVIDRARHPGYYSGNLRLSSGR